MPTAKKKPAAPKKTATKKAAAHRKVVSARAPRQSKQTFLTVRPTIETVYWIVLGVAVIALVAWVLHLTAKIDNLYNQVEINNSSNALMTQPHKTTKPEAK